MDWAGVWVPQTLTQAKLGLLWTVQPWTLHSQVYIEEEDDF